MIQCFCPKAVTDFYHLHSDQCNDTSPYSGCPSTFNGSGCASNKKAWITVTNALSCPGQQNRASNNFWLVSGASSGNYLITILPDSLNTSSVIPYISFDIYHNVGAGQDDKLGRYANGYKVQLNSGNYCYYVGGPSGAVGPFNVCFTPA